MLPNHLHMHRYKSDEQKHNTPGAKLPGFGENEQQGKAYFANTRDNINDPGVREIIGNNTDIKIGDPEMIKTSAQVT